MSSSSGSQSGTSSGVGGTSSYVSTSAASSAVRKSFIQRTRAKSLAAKWEQIYRPALYQMMVTMVKDTSSSIVPILTIVIEFFQILAYCFPHVNWGSVGNAFGSAIRFTQFEFIFYSIFDMGKSSNDGWAIPLDDGQIAVMWVMASLCCAVLIGMLALSAYVFMSFASRVFASGVLPLRILRFLVSVLCGVLYIPLLQVYLSAIKIGFVDAVPGLTALGFISTFLFIPFSFFMSLTYFNPNPMSKSIMSRVSASLEIVEMTFRTLVVFLDVFAAFTPSARLISVLILSSLLCAFVAIFVPYHRKAINSFRFNLFILLAFTGLVGTIGAFVYDDNDDADALMYSWLGLLPVVLLAGVVLFEFLYTRTTLKYFRILKRVSQEVPPAQRRLAYETELSRHKFYSPLTVEVASRFIRDERILDPETRDPEILEIATAIFDRGLQQMPRSPQMHALAAIYQGVYLRDMASWKGLLEKANSLNPSLVVGLLIAQSTAMRESEMRKNRSGGNALDVVDLIEIKNSLTIAKRLSNRVKSDTLQLWRMLLSGKIQPSDIRKYASKIYSNEESARKVLESTVSKYTEEISALAAYAKFLDEISRDYEICDEVCARIEEIEARNATLRDEIFDKNLKKAEAGETAVKEVDVKKANSQLSVASSASKGNGMGSKMSLQSSVAGKITSRLPPRLVQKFKNYKAAVGRVQSTTIPRVVFWVKTVFFIFAALQLFQLIYFEVSSIYIEADLVEIHEGVIARDQTLMIPYQLRLMREIMRVGPKETGLEKEFRFYLPSGSPRNMKVNLDYLGTVDSGNQAHRRRSVSSGPKNMGLFDVEFVALRNEVLSGIHKFEAATYGQYYSLDENSDYFQKWIDPFVPIKKWTSDDEPAIIEKMTFLDANLEFVRHVLELMTEESQSKEFWDNIDSNVNWRFIMDNGPLRLGAAIRENVNDYFDHNTSLIIAVEEVEIGVLVASLCLLVILAIFTFRPAVNHIFKEFDLAAAAIMCIPKDAVEANYGRLKEVMNVTEKKKKLSDKKFGLSALPENGDEDEDSDDSDDDMIDNLETRDDLHSRAQLYLVLTGRYFLILFFLAIIFIAVMATSYILSVQMQQANVRTKLSSEVRILSWRIGYVSQMMSWNDEKTYENVRDLRERLDNDREEFFEFKDGFMFGAQKFSLDYSALEENIRGELFDHIFINDTGGRKYTADQMSNIIYERSLALLVSRLPLTAHDENLMAIVEKVPDVATAFGNASQANDELLSMELHQLVIISGVLFGLAVLGFYFVYNVFFMPFVARMKSEHDLSLRLLLLLPLESLKRNYPLQVLLRGKAAAKEYIKSLSEDDEEEILDETGLPDPTESVVNLDYVRQVLAKSSDDLSKKISKFFRDRFRNNRAEELKNVEKKIVDEKKASRPASISLPKIIMSETYTTDATASPSLRVNSAMNSQPQTPSEPNGRRARSVRFPEQVVSSTSEDLTSVRAAPKLPDHHNSNK